MERCHFRAERFLQRVGSHPRVRIWRLGALASVIGLSLSSAPLAIAFFQPPDQASPESSTAQVVAQGVVNVDEGDLRWQIVEASAPPPANAAPQVSDSGFLVVDSGVMLVEDLESGTQLRLPAGEAMLTEQGASQTRAALGADNALYFGLSLVGADQTAEQSLFVSEPFAGPGARHDVDLLQDVLAPGTTLSLPAGALPTLVFVTDGSIQVATEAGDVVALGAPEAIALSGALVLTAAENGAAVTAIYAGPAVPRLGQAAVTAAPQAISTPATDAAATAATPSAAIEIETAPASAVDEDSDGLSTSQEARENTDPALADTDEDGLTDGEEVLTIGTAPLAPDTDGDGVLDGDEVAQGTDPLTVSGAEAGATEPAAEGTGDAAVVVEPAAEAPAAVVEAAPGDSDGDGLEDVIEFELGTDAADTDTDDDGASDGDEYYVHVTGTRNPDSDGDGVLDGDEVANGTDPNDINSF